LTLKASKEKALRVALGRKGKGKVSKKSSSRKHGGGGGGGANHGVSTSPLTPTGIVAGGRPTPMTPTPRGDRDRLGGFLSPLVFGGVGGPGGSSCGGGRGEGGGRALIASATPHRRAPRSPVNEEDADTDTETVGGHNSQGGGRGLGGGGVLSAGETLSGAATAAAGSERGYADGGNGDRGGALSGNDGAVMKSPLSSMKEPPMSRSERASAQPVAGPRNPAP